MAKACRILGMALIWASVVVIPLGTHFQRQSPPYQDQRRRVMDERSPSVPEGLNPAGRMALVAGDDLDWLFALGFCGFVASVFTVGLFGIRLLGRWQRDLYLIVGGAFGCGCCIGALLGVGSALGGFREGSRALGFGFLLSAAGLLLGAIGLLADRPTRHAPTPGPFP